MNRATRILLSLWLGVWGVAVGDTLAQTNQPARQTPPAQNPQTQTNQDKQNKQNNKAVDGDFMTKAAESGLAEVLTSQLATSKSTNEEVKAFAQRMVDDHTKANDELKGLAGNKNVTLPTTPNAKQRATHDRLNTLSGADFDREYMREQVRMHNEAVALFEKETRNGRDQDVKAWAGKTLPTLREHQRLANDLSGKLGGPLGKANKKGSGT
jgi:putative membrane protein